MLVVQPPGERGGQRRRIAGRNQLAGADAIRGRTERFGQPADGGSYDGQAVGERFGDGHAVGLRAGRRDEQVGGGVRVAERRAGQDAAEPDAVVEAEARDTGPQLFDEGRVAVDEAAISLAADPPGLVHLTAVASHRGVVQPLQQMGQLCRELGLPLVVDAAQALGQVDCAVGVDAVYASSRKWMAGPRGVGVLAVRPTLMQRLQPRLPPPEWISSLSVAQRLELGEANVAARVGFSVALGEHIESGPAAVRARLAEVGRISRTVLADLHGWRVVEAVDEPSAITTLAPLDGADPQKVRAWLIAERRIVTTSAGVERAPLELTTPVLRISPHVDATADDLTTFAAALTDATAAV